MWRKNKFWTYERPNGGRVKIDILALVTFQIYVQNDKKLTEAGGVLLGRFILNSNDIVIDQVSCPQKNDLRKRTFFRRGDDHQVIINEVWKSSQGTCNYLGEWHTHPEDIPTPSVVDIVGWKKQLKDAKYEGTSLLFAVVGIEEIVMYEGKKSSFKIYKLNKIKNNNER